ATTLYLLLRCGRLCTTTATADLSARAAGVARPGTRRSWHQCRRIGGPGRGRPGEPAPGPRPPRPRPVDLGSPVSLALVSPPRRPPPAGARAIAPAPPGDRGRACDEGAAWVVAGRPGAGSPRWRWPRCSVSSRSSSVAAVRPRRELRYAEPYDRRSAMAIGVI